MSPSDQQPPPQDPGETVDDASTASPAEVPFVAKLVPAPSDNETGEAIRVGSPFRDLENVDAPPVIEAAYADYGPFLYIAMGASVSALIVLTFAAAGSWWFPPGGALVAVLGVVLSIVGVFSTRKFRVAAIAALPLHMALFVLSYARSLQG